jgi:hypothetical protein
VVKDWPTLKDAIQSRADARDTTWLLESGRALALFFAKQIKDKTAMVESNDIARVISAHKAFANWLTEGLHWIHSIPVFSLQEPMGS